LKLSQIVKVAYKEALKAKSNEEVPVGAVIFNNTGIVSKAYNQVIKQGDHLAHAEILAIKKATRKLKTTSLKGYNIYTTLEPCLLCSYAISKYLISTIYFGAYDIKNGNIENGMRIFNKEYKGFRPEIYGGIGMDQSSKLIKNFFEEVRKKN